MERWRHFRVVRFSTIVVTPPRSSRVRFFGGGLVKARLHLRPQLQDLMVVGSINNTIAARVLYMQVNVLSCGSWIGGGRIESLGLLISCGSVIKIMPTSRKGCHMRGNVHTCRRCILCCIRHSESVCTASRNA